MMAVVRIKGEMNTPQQARETMRFLRLENTNHLVLVNENASVKGMLKKVAHLVTFGEINAETLTRLLEKRGRQTGNKRLDAAFLKQCSAQTFEEIAQMILSNKKTLQELGIKPVFRLHPPRKGFARGGIKRSFSVGGVWGNRGKAINELIQKMS